MAKGTRIPQREYDNPWEGMTANDLKINWADPIQAEYIGKFLTSEVQRLQKERDAWEKRARELESLCADRL